MKWAVNFNSVDFTIVKFRFTIKEKRSSEKNRVLRFSITTIKQSADKIKSAILKNVGCSSEILDNSDKKRVPLKQFRLDIFTVFNSFILLAMENFGFSHTNFDQEEN